jgi:hypothetical protein
VPNQIEKFTFKVREVLLNLERVSVENLILWIQKLPLLSDLNFHIGSNKAHICEEFID